MYAFLFSCVSQKDAAWDCGTGNGQVAVELAAEFTRVCATDISTAQLQQAARKDNISYRCTRSENTGFPEHTFDLITVAQAIHWFDFDAFYQEVRRVGKPAGVVAVWGYGLTKISSHIDALVLEFYTDILGKYWDAERRHIDEAYASVPFPFRRLEAPEFAMNVEWTVDHFIGYLTSWSAVQNYCKSAGDHPVRLIQSRLEQLWRKGEVKEVRFPLFLRAGKVGTSL